MDNNLFTIRNRDCNPKDVYNDMMSLVYILLPNSTFPSNFRTLLIKKFQSNWTLKVRDHIANIVCTWLLRVFICLFDIPGFTTKTDWENILGVSFIDNASSCSCIHTGLVNDRHLVIGNIRFEWPMNSKCHAWVADKDINNVHFLHWLTSLMLKLQDLRLSENNREIVSNLCIKYSK